MVFFNKKEMDIEENEENDTSSQPKKITLLKKPTATDKRTRRKNNRKRRNPVYKKEEKSKIHCEENYFSNFQQKLEKAKAKTANDLALYLIQILKEDNVLLIT